MTKKLDKLRNRKERLLASLAFLRRCREDHTIPSFAKIVHHIKTPAAIRITRRASLALVRERIRYTRRRLDETSRELISLHLQLASTLSPTSWEWLDAVSWSQANGAGQSATFRQTAKYERLAAKSPQQEPRRTVINCTEKIIDEATLSVLGKGLNFAPTPTTVPTAQFISAVEQAALALPRDAAEEIRRETCRVLTKAPPPKPNISKEERMALKRLREDTETVILPADKGNCTVLLPRHIYLEKLYELLAEDNYRRIEHDPTNRVKRKTTELIQNTFPDKKIVKKLRPRAAVPPRLYGLPKVHKERMPLRPIVSNIGAPTYELAKHLTAMLSPFVGKCQHHVRNSTHFVQQLKEFKLSQEDLMVSFDVVSLFTKVPLRDTLNLIAEKLGPELTNLFEFVLTSTYFLFDGNYYEQTDGVAMGCPLSPVVANLFMEAFEEEALETAVHKPSCFLRYVDDTFVIWPHGQQRLRDFLQHLNSLHQNIKFTMETEENNQLPFLDVLVKRRPDGTLGHSVYRKPTHTDLYLHASSCHAPSQRQGVLSTLVHRAREISDPDSLAAELQHLQAVFRANGYNNNQIKRAFKPKKQKPPPAVEEEKPVATAFLPFVGNISTKIGRILRKHKVKCVFRPPAKTKDLVGSVKDDLGLRKPGVYRIPCECGKIYIGQTIRTVEERCTEHKRHTDNQQPTKSAIADHCITQRHAMKYDGTKLLQPSNTFWDCVLKEAIEIRLNDELINKDNGFQLSKAWDPALNKIKLQRLSTRQTVLQKHQGTSDQQIHEFDCSHADAEDTGSRLGGAPGPPPDIGLARGQGSSPASGGSSESSSVLPNAPLPPPPDHGHAQKQSFALHRVDTEHRGLRTRVKPPPPPHHTRRRPENIKAGISKNKPVSSNA